MTESQDQAPAASESSPGFVHLRLHTEFSIVDGLVRINPLLARARELNMPAIAVTDLANMFGLIKFYSGAIKGGIKPVCGCDVVVRGEEGAADTRLLLLAKDREGYLNLSKLISLIYTDNPNRSDASLRLDQLGAFSDGVIALSGGQFSDIGAALLEGDQAKAAAYLSRWRSLFPESFYLELQRVGREREEDYIDAALDLAAATRTPVVATNDVRFLEQDDFDAHEVRVCINDRRTLDDPRRSREYTDQQYLKEPAEMLALFHDIPSALENSVEIAKRCNLSLDLGTPRLPNYPVPDGLTMEEFFSQISVDGLKRRLISLYGEGYAEQEGIDRYWERLDFELKIINQMGFAGYFLIVMEFIQWSKDNGIPVGPGRGSGAGSIVAYALKITDLDPLKYDLLFERFLNPERVSMPDFDVDFCMEGRDRVIQHVAELYGKEAVSQIITFGTLAAKAVVRDVARVQGKPYALADKLSKLIPFEPGMTLTKAFEEEPELGAFVDSDEEAQEIIEMAFKLEGITRNVGKHAGGVVIAPTKLTDFTPLYTDEAGQGLVTQFDKNDVETAGLVKFDFLGLRTLTIIDWAVKMINERRDEGAPELNIDHLELNDERVYKLLQSGETTAIFQLESRGMKELIKKQVPNCFEDIIALVALFRPGPLQSGMVDDFIDRKHGRTKVVYPHPELAPVLSNTYGVILYQEQVMQIAQVLGNYTLGGADILRKAMGKKNPDEMAKQRSLFTEGAIKRDIDADLAESIFDLMEKFAGYGFNKSHSAAYALVSYQTAWLKTHYPSYFMAAVLSADMQNTDKVVTLIEECRAMGLKIVPPDINKGQFNFTVNEADEIVYGLGAIKGLGEGPVGGILKAREDGPFTNMLELCQRVDSQQLNRRTLEAMVKAGALDSLVEGVPDSARAKLTELLPQAMKAAEQANKNAAAGVADMFGEIAPEGTTASELSSETSKIKPWAEQERLKAEKETLGLYLSGHPIDEYLSELSHLTRDRLANLRPERAPQPVAGLLIDARTMRNKAGDTVAFLTLDDRSGRFEIRLFAKEYERFRDILQKDQIVIVDCTVSMDDYSGGMQGRGKEVMTLEQARQRRARSITLSLRSDALAEGFSEHLAQVLESYRLDSGAQPQSATAKLAATASYTDDRQEGSLGCGITISYQREAAKGCIMLSDEWRVAPSNELVQRLRSEYGRANVVVDY
jgi:DNA polymerase-3 subunit alpha